MSPLLYPAHRSRPTAHPFLRMGSTFLFPPLYCRCWPLVVLLLLRKKKKNPNLEVLSSGEGTRGTFSNKAKSFPFWAKRRNGTADVPLRRRERSSKGGCGLLSVERPAVGYERRAAPLWRSTSDRSHQDVRDGREAVSTSVFSLL